MCVVMKCLILLNVLIVVHITWLLLMLLPGYKIQTGLCWVFVIKLLAYFLPKEICSHISFIFPSYFLQPCSACITKDADQRSQVKRQLWFLHCIFLISNHENDVKYIPPKCRKWHSRACWFQTFHGRGVGRGGEGVVWHDPRRFSRIS